NEEGKVAMSSAEIYFGKSGKIYGPYTDRDVTEMRVTGEIFRFTWMWESSQPGWQPVDPAPAPVTEASAIEAPLAPETPMQVVASMPVAPTPRRALKMVSDPIDAICHDYRHVVAGRIVRVVEGGCELLAPNDSHGTPQFRDRAKVYLNLLNSKTG